MNRSCYDKLAASMRRFKVSFVCSHYDQQLIQSNRVFVSHITRHVGQVAMLTGVTLADPHLFLGPGHHNAIAHKSHYHNVVA